jgi:1-acyl-sn-glycerol-3-phosphate acyltransferase
MRIPDGTMIRFLTLNAAIVLYSALFCVWGLFLSAVYKTEKTIHFHVAVPWARGILRICGIKVAAYGQEHIQAEVPRIYMTNHESYFDIFALLAYVPVDFKFIMKKELMRIPLLGPTMRKAGYIGIVRDEPRKAVKSLNQAAEKIKNGASVVIFPEGTRSPDGRLQEFKKGGFMLALKSGCDIVPVGIRGSRRIVPKGSLRINRGSFSIHIGKPISVKGYTKDNLSGLMRRVREGIAKLLEVDREE